ncbi:MAG: PAS domain-containing sensor histidine kinase [Syntrophus sp. (in: bacteria)]|nr:PAS domain-containing sensor histidine kinase [Syntrophus sp. (in: bacteria)]
MKNKTKTKSQLLEEIKNLRDRLTEQEMIEAERSRLECELSTRTHEFEEWIRERILAQSQMEKLLPESEKRFRALAENSPTGIFIVQNGRIIYENPEEQSSSGPLARLFSQGDVENIHSEDIDKATKGYQDIISGRIANLDLDFRFYQWNDDESDIDMKWVICRASRIEYLGEKAILVNKLDVTRTKELEYLLRIEDKMASLGRVAAGIAHEIRNPLSGINIYLSNLEKILAAGESPEKGKEILLQIQSASNKIEAVIRRVMDFARPREPKITVTDLNRVIEETLDLSAVTMIKDGIRLDKKLWRNLPSCQIDPHLMGQVMLNLITNAAEAMKNMSLGKMIEVTSSVAGGHIIIKISDSGPGVPVHLRKKIFDPFYTTKSGNTGIGLSLSKRIVADHGGFLSVATSTWGGSEFKVEIPLQQGKIW